MAGRTISELHDGSGAAALFAGGVSAGIEAPNADQRTGTAANGKPSYSVDQAGTQITRTNTTWGTAVGQPTVVTYAYRATAPDTLPDVTGWSRFNDKQIAATEIALASWSDVANIRFDRVGSDATGDQAYSNDAIMLLNNYSGGGGADTAGFAYFPGDRTLSSVDGDTWINVTVPQNADPITNSYGQLTLTHEIGHAIGLSHPGDYNASEGAPNYEASAVYNEDSGQFTLMSYWSESKTGGDFMGVSSSAPLLDDIAAVQRLYGANMTTRTGDTVYGFNSNTGRGWLQATSATSDLIFAAWDAGGNDTFDFSGYSSNQKIDLRSGYFSDVGRLKGNVTIAIGAVIENAIGGAGDDLITGNAAANGLSGGAGSDTLYGFAGDDRLSGGLGINRLDGGEGFDMTDYGARSDALWVDLAAGYFSSADTYDLLVSVEGVIGGSGADQLFGAAGAERLYGGAGSDVLSGQGGDDLLSGGAGVNQLDGGAGTDVADYTGQTTGMWMDLAAGYVSTGAIYDRLISIEGLIGGSGNDQMFGTAGDDLLQGGAGNDVLTGRAGSDRLAGGLGINDLQGGDGDDFADYSATTTGVYVDLSNGAYTSAVSYDNFGSIEGLIGGSGNDFLLGTVGNNTLMGGDGADVLIGRGGNDILMGGAGNDRLIGDIGDDSFYGGAGADVFDVGTGGGRDTAFDFNRAEDRIYLGGGAFTALAVSDYNGDGVSDSQLSYSGGAFVALGISTLALNDWNGLLI